MMHPPGLCRSTPPMAEARVIQEFKDFINRGNFVDLAVAFVMGVAFSAVVTA